MPMSDGERRSQQRRTLTMLKKIRIDNPGLDIKGLKEQIIVYQSEMDEVDVALVDKHIEELRK